MDLAFFSGYSLILFSYTVAVEEILIFSIVRYNLGAGGCYKLSNYVCLKGPKFEQFARLHHGTTLMTN